MAVLVLVLICDVLWYGDVTGLFQIKMQSAYQYGLTVGDICHAALQQDDEEEDQVKSL